MKFIERHVRLVFFGLGLFWGIALTFTGGVLFLRASLIREIPGSLSYEKTVEEFPRNASAVPGWTVRTQKCGLPAGKIAVFELCSRKWRDLSVEDSRFPRYFSTMPSSIFSCSGRMFRRKTSPGIPPIRRMRRLVFSMARYVFPSCFS